jgi:hypothetical protein
VTEEEVVVLARYVRALCPQQKFDEYTPDAWHDVLGDYELLDCRRAAAQVAKRQPFVSPAEIIAMIESRRTSNARDIQGPGQPAEIPDADPDNVAAYIAAIRSQRTRAADGMELKPRNISALLSGVGHEVPADDKPRGPLGVPCPHCQATPLHACRSSSGRRLALFHPSRIESGHGRPVVSGTEEMARRKAASAAALAQLPEGFTPQPQDDVRSSRRGEPA